MALTDEHGAEVTHPPAVHLALADRASGALRPLPSGYMWAVGRFGPDHPLPVRDLCTTDRAAWTSRILGCSGYLRWVCKPIIKN